MMIAVDKSTLLLETERMYLRSLREDDITNEYIEGLNDPEVNRYLVLRNTQTFPLVREYIRQNFESPAAILFGVFLKNDRLPFIGTIRISGLDFFHYLANVGVCLFAKRAWKKGYAVEAMRAVVAYAFGDIGLHYLEAVAYAENLNSIKLFRKAGFFETYRLKDKYRHGHKFKEVVYFGIVNKDFKESVL